MDEEQERLSEAYISTAQWATRYHRSRSPSIERPERGSPPRVSRPALSPNDPNKATFPYESLASSKREIRILQLNPDPGNGLNQPIVCRLFQVPLDNTPSFEALSYAWGVAGDRMSRVYINGLAVDIRESLYRALDRLRRTTAPRLLWVDALCIDQCNQEEVGDQVSKMGEIFAGASSVIVWLGEAQANNGAFSLLDSIIENLHAEEIVGEILNREVTLRLLILSVKYSEETIGREFGSSRSMSWTKIVEAQTALIERFLDTLNEVSQKPNGTEKHIKYLRHAVQFRGPRSLILDRANLWRDTQQIDLFECLMMHRLKEATDPRDKIYALVDLTKAANDPSFVVDYNLSTRQVYIDTVDYLLQNIKGLDIVLVQTKGYGRRFFEMDLPSWVPDFGSTDGARPAPFRHAVLKSAHSASALRKAEAQVGRGREVLKVVGIRIASIKAIAPSKRVYHADDLVNGSAKVESWKQYAPNHLGKSPKHLEHLARLLLCDIIMPEDLSETTETAFLQSIVTLFEEDH